MSAEPYPLDLPATSPEAAAEGVLAPDERPTVTPPTIGERPQEPPEAVKRPVAPRTAHVGANESQERARGVAVGGRVATVAPMPSAPQWPSTVGSEYVPDEELDASDLGEINRELNRCRARLFRVSESLKHAQRELRDAELLYSRQMRRALVKTTGGTAETRRAVAEMECEPFENDMVVKQQVVEELRKRALDVRDDLKAVENLSHNARAQMNLR